MKVIERFGLGVTQFELDFVDVDSPRPLRGLAGCGAFLWIYANVLR